jgi:hypothetical protein
MVTATKVHLDIIPAALHFLGDYMQKKTQLGQIRKAPEKK